MRNALAAACMLTLAACPALAQPVDVPNPSFEEGAESPAAWTLSRGAGGVTDDAADGNRAVTVTGNEADDDTNYWRSPPLDFAPDAVYRLRFHARRVTGNDGAPISGPMFSNRDLRQLDENWRQVTSYFATPSEITPENAWMRFGQWHAGGTLAYDGVELHRAQPVYNRVDGVSLGAGEAIRDGVYVFNAPLESDSANHARPLAGYHGYFNKPRWVFGAGNWVTYRHNLEGVRQTSAHVEITVGYCDGGALAVDAGTDGESWQELGSLAEQGTLNADLPPELFPADMVWLRMRAKAREELDADSPMGSFQVHGYKYTAELGEELPDALGHTRFLAVETGDERLEVKVTALGEGRPGGDNVLEARITNHAREAVTLSPAFTLAASEGAASTARLGQVRIEPEETAELSLLYEAPGAGEVNGRFTLGGGSTFAAETSFHVSSLFRADYGETLPGATETVGLWWASSGWKVGRHRPLPKNQGAALRIQAARNETEAAQLVVRPAAALKGLTAHCEPLAGPDGAVVPAGAIELLRVRYVDVTIPTDEAGAVAQWPDPLPPCDAPVDVPADTNQPLWVRVHVPADTPGGIYRGEIALAAEGYQARIPVEVEVFDFTLPDRMTCVTAFGFNHGLAFQYHGVKEEARKRQVYGMYLDTLSAHHISPYNPAALDPLQYTWPELNEETDLESYAPEFDWTAWDQAMEAAIDKRHFNSFRFSVPGMGGGTFHSRYEPELLGYPEDTPQYQAAFNAWCRLAQAHLREKGWLDEAFVYWFDEPDPKDYDFVMNGWRKLKEAAPDIDRMLTEQIEPALIGGPNIWCPLTPAFDLELAEQRRAEGEKFWWYVCTGPKAPYVTLFIDHPGTEMRVWLWQTWKRRISGILIWQTNYWTSSAAYPDEPQNPYADPMGWTSGYSTAKGTKRPWGNGDGRFIYPPEAAADGRPDAPVLEPPVDCIRFEMLRDGIEDYEYMVMLERLLEKHGGALPQHERARLQALLDVPDDVSASLTEFTSRPEPIEAHRAKVAAAIAALSAGN